METHFQAALGRIHDIEARLGIVRREQPSPAPAVPPSASKPGEVPPFPVMLEKANGSVQLQPIGPHAGPFTPQIETLIGKYSTLNGLDPDLVRSVVQQESEGNPGAVSGAGAQGLMQLMPDTAKMYGVRDSLDPEQNISAGTRHLANLMREFNSDVPTALAAYNAGSGAVRKFNGVPPYAETQQYVRRIQDMLSSAKQHGPGLP